MLKNDKEIKRNEKDKEFVSSLFFFLCEQPKKNDVIEINEQISKLTGIS